jgi:serine/threonine-protein kinase RsbW
MTPVFEAELLPQAEAITNLTGRLMDFLRAEGVDPRATHHVGLAVEELLTNLATHGHAIDRPATIKVAVEPHKVRAEIGDHGPHFDLRNAAEPDLTTSIEDRAVGGLGLFLIKRFASDIGYVRRGEMNVTTFAVARNIVGR